MYQLFPLTEVPQREKFDRFAGLIDDVFCPMQCQPNPASAGAFDARIEATDLGNIKLARVCGTSVSGNNWYISLMRFLAAIQQPAADRPSLVLSLSSGITPHCSNADQVNSNPRPACPPTTCEDIMMRVLYCWLPAKIMRLRHIVPMNHEEPSALLSQFLG